jgi:hypothetical protein
MTTSLHRVEASDPGLRARSGQSLQRSGTLVDRRGGPGRQTTARLIHQSFLFPQVTEGVRELGGRSSR